MKKNKERRNKGKSGRILAFVLFGALIIGALGSVVAFAHNDSKTIFSREFSRGGLDPLTGKYVETNKTIYTEKAFECIGLRIEPDFESTVTFDVYYYDKNENLLDTKLGLTEVYDEDFPLAQYCRIVIHPEIPEDVKEKDFEIEWNKVNKYAKMLKITVDKEQNYLYEESLNLYDPAKVNEGKSFSNITSETSTSDLISVAGCKVTHNIVVDGTYEYYDVYVLFETTAEDYSICGIFNSDGSIANTDGAYEARNPFDFDKPIWVKMTLEVPEADDYEGMHLAVAMPLESNCYIYGYND